MTTLLQACALVAASLTPAAPGWAKADQKGTVKLELRRAETKPANGLTEAVVPGSGEKIYMHKTAELTNDDIAAARVVEDPNNKKVSVEIAFTKAGAKKMGDLSKKQLNKPLAILINGKVVSAPVVKAVIVGRAVITGDFTKEEAEKIAKGIVGS